MLQENPKRKLREAKSVEARLVFCFQLSRTRTLLWPDGLYFISLVKDIFLDFYSNVLENKSRDYSSRK